MLKAFSIVSNTGFPISELVLRIRNMKLTNFSNTLHKCAVGGNFSRKGRRVLTILWMLPGSELTLANWILETIGKHGMRSTLEAFGENDISGKEAVVSVKTSPFIMAVRNTKYFRIFSGIMLVQSLNNSGLVA